MTEYYSLAAQGGPATCVFFGPDGFPPTVRVMLLIDDFQARALGVCRAWSPVGLRLASRGAPVGLQLISVVSRLVSRL